jgi:predicted RNase H-like HicB family nuclease
MSSQYTAIIKNTGEWWVGWIEEIPGVNCQERTREELVETLRITLKEALELNREDALTSAGPDFQEDLQGPRHPAPKVAGSQLRASVDLDLLTPRRSRRHQCPLSAT